MLCRFHPFADKVGVLVHKGDEMCIRDRVWIGLGGTQSAVYATEVSAEEYLAYTTEETEKVEVYRLAEKLGGDIEAAIRELAERRRNKE